MIQQQTVLKVIDNSGAKKVKCIKVLGGFKRKFAHLGDVIVVSIKQLRTRYKITSKVQKGQIYKALILRTKKTKNKKDGSKTFFAENSVSLINKQGNPIASRIVGPIPRKLKKKKFMKFATLSSGFV